MFQTLYVIIFRLDTQLGSCSLLPKFWYGHTQKLSSGIFSQWHAQCKQPPYMWLSMGAEKSVQVPYTAFSQFIVFISY